MEKSGYKIHIIGAGVSGLIAAQILENYFQYFQTDPENMVEEGFIADFSQVAVAEQEGDEKESYTPIEILNLSHFFRILLWLFLLIFLLHLFVLILLFHQNHSHHQFLKLLCVSLHLQKPLRHFL